MPRGSDRSLWIAVGLAFAVFLTAWAVLFVIAAKNRPQELPPPPKQTAGQ